MVAEDFIRVFSVNGDIDGGYRNFIQTSDGYINDLDILQGLHLQDYKPLYPSIPIHGLGLQYGRNQNRLTSLNYVIDGKGILWKYDYTDGETREYIAEKVKGYSLRLIKPLISKKRTEAFGYMGTMYI